MRPYEPGAAVRFAAGLTPGIHSAPMALTAGALMTAVEASGLATFLVDLRDASGKAGLLDAMATGLDFPGWVGRNWDALEDALRDLSWLPAGPRGRALVLRGLAQPDAGSSEELKILTDVLDSAVSSWADTDTPLSVVIVAQGLRDAAG